MAKVYVPGAFKKKKEKENEFPILVRDAIQKNVEWHSEKLNFDVEEEENIEKEKEIYIKPLPINIWVLRRNHFCKTYNQELKDIYNELVEYNENYLDKLEFKDFVSFIYNNFYNQ